MDFKLFLSGLSGVAVLGLAMGSAYALDYCLSFPKTPSFVIVGKAFSIPAKGTCKAWVGYSPQSGENSPATGTACTSTDGSHMNMTITVSFPESGGSFFELESISLALPSQTGEGLFTDVFGTSVSSGAATTNGAKCTHNTIPAARLGETSGPHGQSD